eukprot:CAMPEP_0114430560 /NCGR_PEP_ID=MMETSP0103-20121206/10107_1 /TAXON_ID=37642 ORGANISM="Paraphysomonas imperforata, Strain PA2" /NCGR_SAMPLE_ID=MMETSP0103 /ASSEMBLY_ACC=CAM_ASM_000201 /LENGTH=414 /DNA_ID=CAMNT_0001600017 /DNA_START=138 /DNA_END=1382 /DNA_ORIENTATION=+
MSISKRGGGRPRNIYHDKKTGVYFNNNFWNIDNVVSDGNVTRSADDADFMENISSPHSPIDAKRLPRVNSKCSRRKPEQNTPGTGIFRRQPDRSSSTTPAFTMRLAQKQLVQHPHAKNVSSTVLATKTRPKSAAINPSRVIGSKGGINPSMSCTWRFRPKSSPGPVRPQVESKPLPYPTVGPVSSSSVNLDDDDVTTETRKIIDSYTNDGSERILPKYSDQSVTPSSLGSVGEHLKFKGWVQAEEKPEEDISELSIILQRSKEHDDVSNKNKSNKSKGRNSSKASDRNGGPNGLESKRSIALPLKPKCLYRGSNWSTKEQLKRKQKNKSQEYLRQKYTPLKMRAPGASPSYTKNQSSDFSLCDGALDSHVMTISFELPSHDSNIDNTQHSLASNSTYSLGAMTDNVSFESRGLN